MTGGSARPVEPAAVASLPPDMCYVDEKRIVACFPLMRQLRPHLETEDVFVARWRRQSAEAGYGLLAVWGERGPLALAGYRLMENLIHGRFLYVDDLVTDAAARGGGHGGRLLDQLKREGRDLGCAKLVLDTALDNVLGHRFYYRNGLLAQALRFNVPLA